MTLPVEITRRLRLPVLCSPLFIISNPDLVIAQCKAGVMGSFPSLNARPLSQLDEWLHRITEELAAWDRDHPDQLSAPFAVNQIVHRTNDRLEQDLELCAKYKVPLVITSLGAREDLNREVHGWGGLVMHDVIDDRFGRKAIEKGADGLIAVAAGAGGHAGRLSPFALVQELRQWFDGPIALSGSIANGNAILAAQAMGADLAYIGSMFIASEEANAVQDYKQMIVDSSASDIVYSNLFTGVHGNYLAPSIVKAGLDLDNLPVSDPSKMNFGSGGNTKVKAWKDIWGCGQGIGNVDAIRPAGEEVERLIREYQTAKAALDNNFVASEAAPSLVSGERRISHARMQANAQRAAQGFRDLGIEEGDSVALFLRNDFAFFEATQAALLVGAYPVPINWHSTSDEAGYILRDCGAKALVVHRDLLPRVLPALPEEVALLVVETPDEIARAYQADTSPATPARAREWQRWLADLPPISDAVQSSRAAVIYTSGTTGVPKGVKRQAAAPDAPPTAAEFAYGFQEPKPIRVLMNGPMYHSAPNSYARLAILHGADIVLQARFDAEEMLALIERYRITHMHIVPTMFVRLLRLPEEVRNRYDLSSLRFVVHGAAPCPPHIKRAMIEWWGPVINEYYGSTEGGLAAWNDSQTALRKPGTVGPALPGSVIRIYDDEGRQLGAGETGEIYLSCAGMPDFTYIGQEDKRAEIDRDGLITLGDMGWLDEEGHLFLCDRKRDMIISGGVNIYPAEIEAALIALDGVKDCAVFGIPDEEFGEAICAHIEPMPGVTLDVTQIKTSLAGTLSRFKVPRHIELASELPREDSGKIFKRKLRDPYWANQQGAI